ncbi:tetrapyrrole biosynthesis uroporphyrinogen III synthase [Mycena crocata]|nr:tetrapyrrole biosynthesis uroporphyrinogen III synthase [Mycena crocata]
MSSRNVLFLRAPSQNANSLDRYETLFSQAGYKPASVPVLETLFANIGELTDIVRCGAQHSGVIITSGRACEAWNNVVELLEKEKIASQECDWLSTPFYVVGRSTAFSLNAIRSAHPHSPFAPTVIRGESTGTSEQLARFILTDLKSSPGSKQKPLLYLTGDKNRDIMPDILHDGNFELSSLKVYQTQGSSRFSEDLKLALKSSSNEDSGTWWIVFFAPSAAEFVTPWLRQQFDLSSTEPTSRTQRRAQIASIGPTTSTFLRDKLNLAVNAVAMKPTPEELLEAIRVHDSSLDG